MENLLLKFSLTPAPMTRFTCVWLGLIWAFALWATIASLWSQDFSRRRRILWILAIIGAPVVGLLAYLAASIFKAAQNSGATLGFSISAGRRR